MILITALIAASLATPNHAAAQSLDGVWQSEGFGNVYEIAGTTVRPFEITTGTCVAGLKATRLAVAVPGREATFKPPHEDAFFITHGSDDNHKLLSHPDGLYRLRIHRLPLLPGVCSHPTANTPLGNFEVFTRTFSEHYIAFNLRHLDWDRTVSENAARLRRRPRQFNCLKFWIR
jgi:hypothetical protein